MLYWVTDAGIELIKRFANGVDVAEWKQDAAHLAAKEPGISVWYKTYHVQVVEIIREYQNVST